MKKISITVEFREPDSLDTISSHISKTIDIPDNITDDEISNLVWEKGLDYITTSWCKIVEF